MDKILILTVVVIFIILLLVISNKLLYKIKHKAEHTKFRNNVKNENQPVYYSSIDFSKITLKDRDYLYNFIREINPNLPHIQRLEKGIVDVVSFELNKTYFKKNGE